MNAIEAPVMLAPRTAARGWTVLPSFIPVPGMGVRAINSFLIKGAEPMLVDTGLAALGPAFLEALKTDVDLEDLRWIWLSHTDANHIGNLAAILERAPHARVVTNFLGMGKMGMLGHDLGRVHLLEPGQRLELADRCIVPVRPPYYDAPETLGFFDPKSRVLFAADSFGALLPEPASDVAEVAPVALCDGLVTWASIDAPWLADIDKAALGRTLAAVRAVDPDVILSGHLPVARGSAQRLTDIVHNAWGCGTAGGIDPLAMETVAAAFA